MVYISPMLPFIADVAYAIRTFHKKPAFAITAIATLALGIGATAAIFSVVDAVLLTPLPYRAPARLVHVWQDMRNRNVSDFPWPPADFHDLRAQTTSFDGIAALTTGRQVFVGAGGHGDAEVVRTGAATPNLFRVLGTRIVTGSDFAEADGTPLPAPPAPLPRDLLPRRRRRRRRARSSATSSGSAASAATPPSSGPSCAWAISRSR